MFVSIFILTILGGVMLGSIVGECCFASNYPRRNYSSYYIIETPIAIPNTYVLTEEAYNDLYKKRSLKNIALELGRY